MKVNDYISGSKVSSYVGETKRGTESKSTPDTQAQPPVEEGGDRVQLSERSREIARIKELVEAAPKVRTEKIEAVKADLAQGKYTVKPEALAGKILLNHLDESI